jgi:hypothetical protein
MIHSDVQRSDEGVNVSAPVISVGASPLRRWGSRLVGAALLAAPMLLALGGPAQASELEPDLDDPTAVVTEAVDPVVEEITETLSVVVDPIRGIVDLVVSGTTETVGGIDAGRPFQAAPPAPSLRGTNPTPGPRTGPASATAPSGSNAPGASPILLLVAVMASARLFLPSFRSSRASRVVAWRSATLALSVERPG